MLVSVTQCIFTLSNIKEVQKWYILTFLVTKIWSFRYCISNKSGSGVLSHSYFEHSWCQCDAVLSLLVTLCSHPRKDKYMGLFTCFRDRNEPPPIVKLKFLFKHLSIWVVLLGTLASCHIWNTLMYMSLSALAYFPVISFWLLLWTWNVFAIGF